jgi:hypothetical protein
MVIKSFHSTQKKNEKDQFVQINMIMGNKSCEKHSITPTSKLYDFV